MSTLNATYVPLWSGLTSFSGGIEGETLRRLTASALQPLTRQSGVEASTNDLHTLWKEAADGRHETVMSAETLEVGKRFLLSWPKALPAPELALDSDGEVNFSWSAPHRRLFSVSLRSDGRLSFAGRLGMRRTFHGTDEFDDAVPERVVESVRELYST